MLFATGKEFSLRCNARLCCRYAVWVLFVGNVCCASATQSPNVKSDASHVREPTKKPQLNLPQPAATGTESPNPSGVSTRSAMSSSGSDTVPARVVLRNGYLTVEADNSDLRQILQSVAGVTGMIIGGDIRSSRVYGVYGPRSPRDVLTELLAGSGYNFIMIGVSSNGAPRELLLSSEKAKSPPEPSSIAITAPETPRLDSPEQDQLGPGAVAHVPPGPSQDPQERVRQNLERLRQMHEKLKEQNAPQ